MRLASTPVDFETHALKGSSCRSVHAHNVDIRTNLFNYPETDMITTRKFLTSLIFTSMAAGLVGMSGLPQENAPTPNEQASPKLKPDPDEPQFLPYARDARPAEIWLHRMLQTPVPKLDFPGETPLSEILEQIATYYTTTYGKSESDKGFTFTFMPDILELELESINSLEDVLISDIVLDDVTLENVLQFIFDQTDPGLTYEIRNEVMVITTKVKAEDSLYTRVYEIEHLLHAKFEQHINLSGIGGSSMGIGGGMNGAGFGGGGFGGGQSGGGLGGGGLGEAQGGGGGGMSGGGGGFFSVQFGGQSAGGLPQNSTYNNIAAQSVTKPRSNGRKRKRNSAGRSRVVNSHINISNLTETIQSVTSPPCQWMNMEGEGGTINPVGNTLVIYQTQAAHQKIVRLLNLLTDATKPAAK